MRNRFKKNPLYMPSSQVPARNFIITVFICSYIVTVVPLCYFLYKSYLMLDEIGVKFLPTLLEINGQDKAMIAVTLFCTFVAGLVIQLFAQKYFLKKLYKPIDLIQSHLSKAILGEFNQPKIPLKQELYAQELIRTYNYFYSSLQTNLKRDITFLKELENKYDPNLARVLLSEKLHQLNIKSEENITLDNEAA